MESQEKSVASITPDGYRVLNHHDFFGKLEHIVFPNGDEQPSICVHSHALSVALLIAEGFRELDRQDILDVLTEQGGCCDCEILWNADPREDSPKSRYWRRQAELYKHNSK